MWRAIAKATRVKEAKTRKGWTSSTRSPWQDQEWRGRTPERTTPEPADHQSNKEEEEEEECCDGQFPGRGLRNQEVHYLQDSTDQNQ